jgi:hypothetical protein
LPTCCQWKHQWFNRLCCKLSSSSCCGN